VRELGYDLDAMELALALALLDADGSGNPRAVPHRYRKSLW
jgi:hypothetical protein